MNEQIREYVNELFEDAPRKRRVVEIQEELLSNMNDKYDDLMRQGKSHDEAFASVIAGIGDIDGLIEDVCSESRDGFISDISQRKKGNLLVAIGVGLYVIAVALMILIDELSSFESLAPVVMLVVVGIATIFVIYGSSFLKKNKYNKEDDSFVEEYKEKISNSDKLSRMQGAISSALWTIIVIAYFLISFYTRMWHVSWVIFIIGAVIQQVVVSIIKKRVMWSGILWTSATIVYLIVSFLSWAWHLTWLIFLVAAAVQQIIRVVNIWRET